MSAIFGLLNTNHRPLPPDTIKDMGNVLAHRGSDYCGYWQNKHIALGCRILWTSNRSKYETIPQKTGNGFLICADCRLDNAKELWSILGNDEPYSGQIPDSEVIIRAYQKWGKDCPIHLLGDYAFAIWDQAEKTLFCARDHLGVRPFYYSLGKDFFAFASEIKGILATERIHMDLDQEWIGEYLSGCWAQKDLTVYKHIKRLPPAHILVVTPNSFTVRRYFSFNKDKELSFSTENQYLEAFREEFFRSVRIRANTDYPIASHLSGGLDSSSIVAAIRHINNTHTKVNTYTNTYESIPKCDERNYVQSMISQEGLNPSFLDVSNLGYLDDFEKRLRHQDYPLTAYNGHTSWYLLRKVKEDGIRVLLDGSDGDSTISYGSGQMDDLIRERKWGSLLLTAISETGQSGLIIWRQLFERFLQSRAPKLYASFRRKNGQTHSTFRAQNQLNDIWELFNPDFLKNCGVEESYLRKKRGEKYISARDLHSKQIDSPRMPLLFEYLDHASSAFGIEKRYPFTDRRLMQYCLSVPTHMKRKKGLDRYIARKSLKGFLPNKIRLRKGKTDFTPNFLVSMKKDSKKAISLLHLSKDCISQYVDLGKLEEITFDDEENVFKIRVFYNAVFFAIWLNKVLGL